MTADGSVQITPPEQVKVFNPDALSSGGNGPVPGLYMLQVMPVKPSGDSAAVDSSWMISVNGVSGPMSMPVIPVVFDESGQAMVPMSPSGEDLQPLQGVVFYQGQMGTIVVKKVWNDGENQGLRPSYVDFDIYLDGYVNRNYRIYASDDWTCEVQNVPVRDEDGNPLEYEVTETTYLNGYTAVTTGNAVEGYTITNTYGSVPGSVPVPVQMVSSGVPNSYPVQVSGTLYDPTNGQLNSASTRATRDGNVSLTFSGLDTADTSKVYKLTIGAIYNKPYDTSWLITDPVHPALKSTMSSVEVKFNESGQLVFVDDPSGWSVIFALVRTPNGSGVDWGSEGSTPLPDAWDDGALRTVTATKVWDDANDQDGIRADVTFRLQSKVGDADWADVEGQEPKTVAADAEGDALTVSWDVPVYAAEGVEIQYQVVEDALDGYTSEVTGDYTDGFTITNTHEPATPPAEPNAAPPDEEVVSASTAPTAEPNAAPPAEPSKVKSEKKSDHPKTGDAGLMVFCGAVVLLAAGAAVLLAAGRRRSRDKERAGK